MAMNKKEKEYVEILEGELRIARALRFTEKVDTDVPIPDSYNKLAKGFLYNAYLGGSIRVEPACSNSVGHSFGSDTKTTSQGARELYSTKELALKALRNDMERQCAVVLARVDKQIEDERASKEQGGGNESNA